MKSVATFVAAVIVLISCAACGPAHGASGSSVVRPATISSGQATDVPETLAAATAAAQANIDRFTAGDFAGVWEHMESDVRTGITQQDFVTFYRTCKKPGSPISVRGLRLEAGEAIVVMKIQGVEKSRTMVYEDGTWNMQATDDFASRLGEPLPQLIAEETAAGLCSR